MQIIFFNTVLYCPHHNKLKERMVIKEAFFKAVMQLRDALLSIHASDNGAKKELIPGARQSKTSVRSSTPPGSELKVNKEGILEA